MSKITFEQTEEVHATKTVRKIKVVLDVVEDNQ